ncbi:MAG: S8 family serine peptidase [Bacteroidetes bacterium]|nr:S8 family serine peptidase [Bacteroidota bacterium]
MKKKKYLITLLLLLSFGGLNAQTLYFYYYKGEKQYLELDTKHIFVSIAKETPENIFTSNSLRQQPLRSDVSEKIQSRTNYRRFWTKLSIEDSLSNEAYLVKLSEIKNKRNDIIVAPYFKNQYQDGIGLSNFFYVKLKSLNDTILLRQKAEKEQAFIVYQNHFMPLWFVMSVTEKSKNNAMEIANRFYESNLFQYAEPDLMVDDNVNCVNDTFFSQQWGLQNTGQSGGTSGIDIKVCEAWQISTGSNVIVAVLDHGIDLTHPDLIDNIHPLSFDCDNGTSPQVVRGNHGTACAGIIGAVRNNTDGIAGVAPNCELMSISSSLSGTPTDRMQRADGINWAWQNGADVISNSWGASVQHQVIDDAIENAITQGRNGRGCVVIFASGNDNASTVSYPASLPNVIAVGAIDRCGIRAGKKDITGSCDPWCSTCQPGSTYGSDLDVVAPGSSVYTTDRQGSAGYNTTNGTAGNYYNDFGGTSAACPFVAGVAALILSVNPCLTWEEVREIISSSCDKVSSARYCYATTAGRPYGSWNNQVGYGLVNAHKAILKTYNIQPTTISNISGTDQGNITLNWDLSVSGCSGFVPGIYLSTKRHEVRATVNYPYTISPTISATSNGLSGANPNYGGNFVQIMDTTETSATLRTFVYEAKYNVNGQIVNTWVPVSPANVRFAVTIYPNVGTEFKLQNRNETTSTSYHAINNISAGKNVTSSVPTGNYTVKSGANVTFRAGNSIILSDGFKAESGSTFRAYIAPFFTCTFSLKSAPVIPDSDSLPFISNFTVEKTTLLENEIIETEKPYLKLFPNPVINDVNIEYKLINVTEIVEITLHDSNGKLVYKLNNNAPHEAGIYTIALQSANLPAGIYICTLKTDKQVFTEKFVKQ